MQSSPAAAADDEPAARGTLSRTVVRRVRGGSAAAAALLCAVAGCLLALAAAGPDGSRAVVGTLAFLAGLCAAAALLLRGAGRLRATRRELDAVRCEGRRKVEELTRLAATLEERTRELAEANARLREADRLRASFLAGISHELRTPLNSILGFSEVLRSRLAGVLDARQRRFLGYIHHAGEQLLRIIDDVLDLSRVEAGPGALIGERFAPGPLVEGVCALLRGAAERRGVRLRIELAADLPELQADPARIEQVLHHLLANAIKFSRADSQVWVRAFPLDAGASPLGRAALALAVEDRGIGIAAADRELIFEAFRQVDGTASREFPGAGLGLAIVRRFVELHGGSVSLESELGRGSTFTVHLPLDALPVPAAEEDASPRRAQLG